jgi:hypothetical protein
MDSNTSNAPSSGFDPRGAQFNPQTPIPQQTVATVTTQAEVPATGSPNPTVGSTISNTSVQDMVSNTVQDMLVPELPDKNDPMFIRFSRSSAIYVLDVILLVNFAIVPMVQLWRRELIAIPTLPEPFYTLGEIFFGLYVSGRVYEKYKGVATK